MHIIYIRIFTYFYILTVNTEYMESISIEREKIETSIVAGNVGIAVGPVVGHVSNNNNIFHRNGARPVRVEMFEIPRAK